MRKLLRVPTSPFDIKPDSMIISDPHLHERKEFERVDDITGLNSRLVEGLDIFKQVIDILNSHPEIKYVFFLGDLFELKDKVPNHILIEAGRLLEEIGRGRKIIYLLGNHDFNIPKYPIVKIFNMDLITETQTITLLPEHHEVVPYGERVQIAFIPFQREFSRFLELWIGIHSGPIQPNIVFFHQEIPGAVYETGREIPGIMDSSLFNPGTLYISGHIHKSQTVGKVQYVGSPYQIRFSDEGQTRYIHLLNAKTGKIAPVKLHYPEFISINVKLFQAIISEGQPTWEELDNLAGNYIRVVGEVPASQWDPQIKRDIRSKLETAGARGISFQVDVVRQHQSQIPTEMVEDDHSIIEMYVKDNSEGIGMDPTELIRVGLELFK